MISHRYSQRRVYAPINLTLSLYHPLTFEVYVHNHYSTRCGEMREASGVLNMTFLQESHLDSTIQPEPLSRDRLYGRNSITCFQRVREKHTNLLYDWFLGRLHHCRAPDHMTSEAVKAAGLFISLLFLSFRNTMLFLY